MLGVAIATVIGIAALIWIVLYVVREQVAQRARVAAELDSPQTPTLEYAVPTGQDPAVIIAALEKAGYTATADPNHVHQLLRVACPSGLDRQREQVRTVIESASVTAVRDGVPIEADVQFADER